MKDIYDYLKNPGLFWIGLANCGFFNWLSDKKYITVKYKAALGQDLDLDNPKTYNEKVQWLKLYDRKSEYALLVDKYEVKEYISQVVGKKYVIPTLGIWDSFDQIEFEYLPEKFALKTTHDSSCCFLVANKNDFDWKSCRNKMNKRLSHNYYYHDREWQYKNVKPRIIAEELIGKPDEPMSDYKFFVFNGKVKAFYITYDRGKASGTKIDVYDLECHRIPMKWGYENSDYEFVKPNNFDEMIAVAEKLGEGFVHIRVDLYNVAGTIYVGELTFHTWAGFEKIIPSKWDYEFGKWIKLPGKTEEG